MKDYKFWIPIIITVLMNIVTIVYMTAVFKTTVETHIADSTKHLTPIEKVIIQDIAKKTILDYERKN